MVTQEELKKWLQYDPETGVFTWISKPNRRLNLGTSAGCACGTKGGKSYIRIMINGKLYHAHRLAFLYTTGSFPEHEVDHINGNGTDNRFCNLRIVDRSNNAKNLRMKSTNKSGVCGVVWHEDRNKWQSFIKIKNKTKYIGLFDSIFEAAAARKSAELLYKFHENHGSARPL
jgi:hypothetical protein